MTETNTAAWFSTEYIPIVDHARPWRCPVCEGKGWVSTGFYAGPTASTAAPFGQWCLACAGTGIVWG